MRTSLRSQRQRERQLWATLAPALVLWAILLGSLGALALAMQVVEVAEPLAAVIWTVLSGSVILLYAWGERRSLWPLLTKSGFTDEDSWWAPVVGAVALPSFMFAYLWCLGALGIASLPLLEGFAASGWPLWSAFVLLGVCPGLFEEIAFRGFLFGRLRQVMGARDALLVQAAMFAVLHLLLLSFVSHFVIGLLFGWLRLRTRSLWPGIVLHAFWNGWHVFAEAYGGW